jgi:hypothetical protein
LATILAASTVVMALPFDTAKASRGGDAETGDFESDGDDNIGNTAVGGDADSEATGGAGGTATGGDDTSTYASE